VAQGRPDDHHRQGVPPARRIFGPGDAYAGRRFCTPSLPPAVYRYLLDAGVRDWVIRFDRLGTAYKLPLSDVERLATVTQDDELAVKFGHFARCPYPDWPYAERAVLVEP